MNQDAHKKLELEEVATILDKLNPEFDGKVFDPLETVILSQESPFYKGLQFLDIADHTIHPPIHRYVLYSDDSHVILTFSNEPIYALNLSHPIVLNEENATEYAKFFFSYVRGRHGRFIITENVDDVNWRDDPPPSARKAIGQMLQPVTLDSSDEKGYHLTACMVFKDSLFKSKITVDAKGYVSLSDEELLVEDMPILDDTFGQ